MADTNNWVYFRPCRSLLRFEIQRSVGMRPVSDFFSGIASGLRVSKTRSCPKREKRATTAAPRSALAEVVCRFFVLMAAVAIGAAALVASAGGPLHAPPPTKLSPRMDAAIVPGEIPAEVTECDAGAPAREWKYIILHHSGDKRGSAQSFDQYHRHERGWKSLGYHFVIGNGNGQGDGEVQAGPRWYDQEAGAHANSLEYNEHGIGICLVGNFDEQPPTPAQLRATRALLVRLCAKFRIAAFNVSGHNQIRIGGATACPGKLLPLSELRAGL